MTETDTATGGSPPAPRGFTDPEFLHLCTALQLHQGSPWRYSRFGATVRCALPGADRRVPALARLPRLDVHLPDNGAAQLVLSRYSGRVLAVPRHLAVSVLELPDDPAALFRGRSRQAVRTNSGRAQKDGTTCRVLGDAEARDRFTELLSVRHEPQVLVDALDHLDHGIGEAWLAQGPTGATETLALVTATGRFARLDLMKSTPGTQPSRYLLTVCLARDLAARGVRHLAVDSALFLPPGLRHFQQLFGFVPTTLSLTSSCPTTAPSE